MIEKANSALESRHYKEAIKFFSDVIEENPNDPLAYQGVAKAFYKLELLDESKRNCEKAIELNANLALPYSILSYIEYKKTGAIDRCFELAEKAFLAEPDLPEVLECFGFACLLKDKNEEGVQYLERALPHLPLKYEAYNNLSIAYTRLNRFDEAYKATVSMFKINPSPRGFIKSTMAYMALNKVKNVSSVVLILSLIGSIYLKAPVLLILPLLYAFVLSIIGIFAILQKVTRVGVITILGSLGAFLLIYFVFKLFF